MVSFAADCQLDYVTAPSLQNILQAARALLCIHLNFSVNIAVVQITDVSNVLKHSPITPTKKVIRLYCPFKNSMHAQNYILRHALVMFSFADLTWDKAILPIVYVKKQV